MKAPAHIDIPRLSAKLNNGAYQYSYSVPASNTAAAVRDAARTIEVATCYGPVILEDAPSTLVEYFHTGKLPAELSSGLAQFQMLGESPERNRDDVIGIVTKSLAARRLSAAEKRALYRVICDRAIEATSTPTQQAAMLLAIFGHTHSNLPWAPLGPEKLIGGVGDARNKIRACLRIEKMIMNPKEKHQPVTSAEIDEVFCQTLPDNPWVADYTALETHIGTLYLARLVTSWGDTIQQLLALGAWLYQRELPGRTFTLALGYRNPEIILGRNKEALAMLSDAILQDYDTQRSTSVPSYRIDYPSSIRTFLVLLLSLGDRLYNTAPDETLRVQTKLNAILTGVITHRRARNRARGEE